MSFGQYSNNPRPYRPSMPGKRDKEKGREKHVFGPRDTGVQHVWANPLRPDKSGNWENGSGYYQTYATNPQRNFYFKTDPDGTRVLYSYRDSYPIASRFTIGKGKRARVIHLVRSGPAYSVTTSGHIRAARSAVPSEHHRFRFTVPYVIRYSCLDTAKYGSASARDGHPDKDTHKANLADIVERLEIAIDTHSRARSGWKMEFYHAQALELRQTAKTYARVFGLKLPKLPAVPKMDAEKLEKLKARETVRASQRETKRQAERAAYAARVADLIPAWRRGEYIGGYYVSPDGYALLRVRPSTTADPSGHTLAAVVETSQHVTVPVSGPLGAARLLRFLQALKTAGRTYQRNGHSEHIGDFVVDSFGPAVLTATPEDSTTPEWILTAGCHRIKWSEIESIAEQVFQAEKLEAEATK